MPKFERDVVSPEVRLEILHDAAENGYLRVRDKMQIFVLDSLAARAILKVYNNLKPANKSKYLGFSIPAMAKLAWTVVNIGVPK